MDSSAPYYKVVQEGTCSILFTDNNYLYYSVNGDSGYTFYRIDYTGNSLDYDGDPNFNDSTGTDDYTPVKILDLVSVSDWYKPERYRRKGQGMLLTFRAFYQNKRELRPLQVPHCTPPQVFRYIRYRRCGKDIYMRRMCVLGVLVIGGAVALTVILIKRNKKSQPAVREKRIKVDTSHLGHFSYLIITQSPLKSIF